MSVSKERRDAIRRELDDPSVDFEPYDATVRALLDMADERDRYRALLEEARDWIDGDKWKVSQISRELVDLYLHLTDRIDAALEGKHEHQ